MTHIIKITRIVLMIRAMKAMEILKAMVVAIGCFLGGIYGTPIGGIQEAWPKNLSKNQNMGMDMSSSPKGQTQVSLAHAIAGAVFDNPKAVLEIEVHSLDFLMTSSSTTSDHGSSHEVVDHEVADHKVANLVVALEVAPMTSAGTTPLRATPPMILGGPKAAASMVSSDQNSERLIQWLKEVKTPTQGKQGGILVVHEVDRASMGAETWKNSIELFDKGLMITGKEGRIQKVDNVLVIFKNHRSSWGDQGRQDLDFQGDEVLSPDLISTDLISPDFISTDRKSLHVWGETGVQKHLHGFSQTDLRKLFPELDSSALRFFMLASSDSEEEGGGDSLFGLLDQWASQEEGGMGPMGESGATLPWSQVSTSSTSPPRGHMFIDCTKCLPNHTPKGATLDMVVLSPDSWTQSFEWYSIDKNGTRKSETTTRKIKIKDSHEGKTFEAKYTEGGKTYTQLWGLKAVSDPSAPRNLRAIPGNGQVVLTWDPPTNDGGLPIKAYYFKYDGELHFARSAPYSRRLVFGLTNGQSYTFELNATNEGSDMSLFTESGISGTYSAGAIASVTATPRANTRSTGLPVIEGRPEVGSTLTASIGSIRDRDGVENVQWQYFWYRTNIRGTSRKRIARGKSYVPTAADVDQFLYVLVVFIDNGGNREVRKNLGVLVKPPPLQSRSTGALTIEGTAAVTEELTANTSGIRDANGLRGVSFSYQWIRVDRSNEMAIPSATSRTYRLVDADLGKKLKVKVSFSDNNGYQEEQKSTNTELVRTRPHQRRATGAPRITGPLYVGEVLTVETDFINDANGLRGVSFSYQWIRVDGSNEAVIANATLRTYTLVDADLGKKLKVKVSFIDNNGYQEELENEVPIAILPADSQTRHKSPEGDILLSAYTRNISVNAHDGSSAFTFDLIFSENIASLSSQILRDSVFTVTRGRITGVNQIAQANRVEPGANQNWRVTVQPSSQQSVEVTLPSTTSCTDSGAICIGDRPLSSAVTIIVPGPTQSQPQQTAPLLTATFHQAPTEHNGSAFTFDLIFSEDIPGLSYKVLRDSVFTVKQGRITGVRRLAPGSNQNWGVTVQPSSQQPVEITLSPTTNCTDLGAICIGDRPLSSGVLRIVRGPATPAQSQPAKSTPPHPPTPPPPTPLTAAFRQVPTEHNGSDVFTLELHFSENMPGLSYKVLRDHAFRVSQGRVNGARRLSQGSNQSWLIKVEPTSHRDVRVSLPSTANCGASGAVCTGDGRKLSSALAAVVLGPSSLSVADVTVKEAVGATLDFVVRLSRTTSSTVTVNWATSDGTATAGSDYASANGTLTFAAGEQTKTVSVSVLDDAHDEGSETLTLTLSNASGARIGDGVATGTINNTDVMPKAWLGRFGRTVVDQVLDTVQDRMSAPQKLGFDGKIADYAIAPVTGESSAQGMDGAERMPLHASSHWLHGMDMGREGSLESRSMTGLDVFMGSSFTLGGETNDGGFVTFWSRGALSSFEGMEEDVMLDDGKVASGLIGVDYAKDRWGVGLILSQSFGSGTYRRRGSTGMEAAGGEVDGSLTSFYPWGRYEVNDRWTLWGTVGYGLGELTLKPKNSRNIDTDIDMWMVGTGLRGEILEAPPEGGFSLALKSDAMMVSTSSDKVTGMMASSADVTRLRVGLEGAWMHHLKKGGDDTDGNGGTVTPSLELGFRHDGGAETGVGLEVGGGLAWHDPSYGVTLDVSGRGLVTHDDENFKDHGLSASFAWSSDMDSKEGPSLMLRQDYGGAKGGLDSMFATDPIANRGGMHMGQRTTMEAGWGFDVGSFFIGTPYANLGFTEDTNDVALGWRLTPKQDERVDLDFKVIQSDRNGEDTEYGAKLDLSLKW